MHLATKYLNLHKNFNYLFFELIPLKKLSFQEFQIRFEKLLKLSAIKNKSKWQIEKKYLNSYSQNETVMIITEVELE